jgi:hypothetical protein
MTKLFASLFATALVIGLGFAPTLTYAEHHEGASSEAADSEESSMDSGDESMTEESDSMEEPQEDQMEEAEDSDKAE